MVNLKLTLPFDTAFSKNRAKTLLFIGPKKRKRAIIGLTSSYRDLLNGYILMAKNQVKDKCTAFDRKKKVNLFIHVVKDSMRSDAINYIDGIADVIKEVIGVDDRYFQVVLTWEIDKKNPLFLVGVTQE